MALVCQRHPDQEATLQCERCHTGAFCTRDCLQEAWPEHQPVCADLRLGRLKVSLSSAKPKLAQEMFKRDNQTKGMVLGMAIGDYLGARATGAAADYFTVNKAVLDSLMAGDADVEVPRAKWPELGRGQVTEPTELWIAVAQGILSEVHNPDRGAARWIMEWANDSDYLPLTISPRMSALTTGGSFESTTPDRTMRAATAKAITTTGAEVMIQASAVALWNPAEPTSLTRKGARLEKHAADIASLNNQWLDVQHAAVAYTIMCNQLMYDASGASGSNAVDTARDYLRRQTTAASSLRVMTDATQSAATQTFDRNELSSARQAFSDKSEYGHHRALYAVTWMLLQLDKSRGDPPLWEPMMRSIIASAPTDELNTTAALAGALLGAYYGQEALSPALTGLVLSYNNTLAKTNDMIRPAWLRAQRLIHLAEALRNLKG